MCFLEVILCLWLLQSFYPLSYIEPWTPRGRKGVIWKSRLGLSTPGESLYCCVHLHYNIVGSPRAPVLSCFSSVRSGLHVVEQALDPKIIK